MPEKSLFQAQKQTKPRIEEAIATLLEGETQQNALAFAAHLRANKMPPTWASANSWKASYRSKGVCYVKIDRHGKNAWWINPLTDYTEAYAAFVEAEGLRDIIWRNPAYCTRCHPNTCAPKGAADTFRGIIKAYFGKDIDHVCRCGDTSFRNPDRAALRCVEKMLAFKRQAIAEDRVPQCKYMPARRRISKTELVTLAQEVKVAGLNLARAGWAHRMEKAGDLWGAYTDAHRIEVRAKIPIVAYGIWCGEAAGNDYIVGNAVDAFEGIGDAFATFTIPAGTYIRDSFNAFDFEELVCRTLGTREKIVAKWAEDSGIAIGNPAFFIEVYPLQDMVKPAGEVTNESFRQDDRLKAKYPMMYTLLPVEAEP